MSVKPLMGDVAVIARPDARSWINPKMKPILSLVRANARWPALFCGAALLTGCLSPKTLEKTAKQNEINVGNYNANVAKLAEALRQEATLHMELQLHAAREQVSRSLTKVRASIEVDDPSQPGFADPQKPWFANLKKESDALREKLREIPDPRARAGLPEKYGVVYDIAAERAGFTVIRILHDAGELAEINNRIGNEPEPAVRRIYLEKRKQLLEQYAIAQEQLQLNKAYRDALDQYLKTVQDQGNIAVLHARAFVGFAQAQPEVESALGVLKDQELREGILGIVAKNNGAATAERLKSRMGQVDEVLGFVEKLRGN